MLVTKYVLALLLTLLNSLKYEQSEHVSDSIADTMLRAVRGVVSAPVGIAEV